uniref:protein LITTLE ZIPPER 1-like n=1 Tax=Erigeron canadensis TaxID=72917 RepID=UPI001CB96A62|nr:protein LITTLE ZIPPER 1-like [Erigeron canadensis]
MCTSNSKECMAPPSLHFLNQKANSKQPKFRVRVRVHRLNRANKFIEEKMKREMELKNLKLYMENMSILKENERLRNKATLLHQERLALLSMLEEKKLKL